MSQGMASQYAIMNGGKLNSTRSPTREEADFLPLSRFYLPITPQTLFLSALGSITSPCSRCLVALLAISQHPIHSKRLAVPMIIAGTTLFSGSIFALLLFKDKMGSLTRIIGPSTPIGGLLMIGGYLSLVSSLSQLQRERETFR